jgi:hypothetical protein
LNAKTYNRLLSISIILSAFGAFVSFCSLLRLYGYAFTMEAYPYSQMLFPFEEIQEIWFSLVISATLMIIGIVVFMVLSEKK